MHSQSSCVWTRRTCQLLTGWTGRGSTEALVYVTLGAVSRLLKLMTPSQSMGSVLCDVSAGQVNRLVPATEARMPRRFRLPSLGA